jgi:hypothetical protein
VDNGSAAAPTSLWANGARRRSAIVRTGRSDAPQMRAHPAPRFPPPAPEWAGPLMTREGRLDGPGCLALHHPQTTLAAGNKEVDLEPLLIAKVVKLLPLALADLALENLGGRQFDQSAEERRPIQLRLGRDPQEVARQSRVAQIHLGRLDEAPAEVLEVRRRQNVRGKTALVNFRRLTLSRVSRSCSSRQLRFTA